MYDIENSIGFLLAKAHQRGWALFSEEISRYELTPPQFSVLAFLWQQDGLTQTELSEKAQIDRTTLGGLIDRLEKIGMVQRRAHPSDRRAHLVYLTEKGSSQSSELSALATKVLDRFVGSLSSKDQQDLVRMLEILRRERNNHANPAL
jgi:DNA-binding MarR family transcriptional regulator